MNCSWRERREQVLIKIKADTIIENEIKVDTNVEEKIIADTNVENNSKHMSKYAWVILLFLFTSALINNVDKAIIGFASVPIMKELNLTATQWGIVGSSFYWLFAISAVVVGGLADTRSTKKILSWMSVVWAAVQFGTLFVLSLPALILSRVILGAGEGPASAVGASIIGKWLPKEKYGMGFACIFIGTALGPAIAAPFLMTLIEGYGWRSAFLAMGIIGLMWLSLWKIFGKESPEDVVKAPSQSNIKHNVSTVSWREFFPTLLSRNFLFILFAGIAAYWLLAVKLIWFPNYFANVREFDGSLLKWAVSLPFVFSAIAQISVALLSDRLYRKTNNVRKSRVYVAGFCMVLSAIGLFAATVVSNDIYSMLLFSLSPGLTTVSLTLLPAVLMATVNEKNIGKAQGIFTAFSTMASIVAPIIFGAIIQNATNNSIGFTNAFHVTSMLILILGILFWIGVRPKDRAIGAEQPKSKAV